VEGGRDKERRIRREGEGEKGEGEGREEGARKGEQGRGRGEQPKLYLICVVTFDPFLVPTRGFP